MTTTEDFERVTAGADFAARMEARAAVAETRIPPMPPDVTPAADVEDEDPERFDGLS